MSEDATVPDEGTTTVTVPNPKSGTIPRPMYSLERKHPRNPLDPFYFNDESLRRFVADVTRPDSQYFHQDGTLNKNNPILTAAISHLSVDAAARYYVEFLILTKNIRGLTPSAQQKVNAVRHYIAGSLERENPRIYDEYADKRTRQILRDAKYISAKNRERKIVGYFDLNGLSSQEIKQLKDALKYQGIPYETYSTTVLPNGGNGKINALVVEGAAFLHKLKEIGAGASAAASSHPAKTDDRLEPCGMT